MDPSNEKFEVKQNKISDSLIENFNIDGFIVNYETNHTNVNRIAVSDVKKTQNKSVLNSPPAHNARNYASSLINLNYVLEEDILNKKKNKIEKPQPKQQLTADIKQHILKNNLSLKFELRHDISREKDNTSLQILQKLNINQNNLLPLKFELPDDIKREIDNTSLSILQKVKTRAKKSSSSLKLQLQPDDKIRKKDDTSLNVFQKVNKYVNNSGLSFNLSPQYEEPSHLNHVHENYPVTNINNEDAFKLLLNTNHDKKSSSMPLTYNVQENNPIIHFENADTFKIDATSNYDKINSSIPLTYNVQDDKLYTHLKSEDAFKILANTNCDKRHSSIPLTYDVEAENSILNLNVDNINAFILSDLEQYLFSEYTNNTNNNDVGSKINSTVKGLYYISPSDFYKKCISVHYSHFVTQGNNPKITNTERISQILKSGALGGTVQFFPNGNQFGEREGQPGGIVPPLRNRF